LPCSNDPPQSLTINLHVRSGIVETTDEHPIYVKDFGWKNAVELRTGDELMTSAGGWVRCEGIADSGQVKTVYNVEVADCHTYFVGDTVWGFDLWAHNYKGGTYSIVRITNKGGQVHHVLGAKVIASVATPYNYYNAPSIWMKKADHRKTLSYGRSAEANEHRAKQAALVTAGDVRGALQLDVDDIRSKFGKRYDPAIAEMARSLGFAPF
jgi:hypothetical protein